MITRVSGSDFSDDFTRLVNERSGAILRYALRRINDPWVCEDIVEDTFLVAWRHRDSIPGRSEELTWLYSIAFRVLSNHRRSRDRKRRLDTRLIAEHVNNSNADTDTVDARSLLIELGTLKVIDRKILEFVYWESLSYREIGQILGLSENAVGMRLHKAKQRLRTQLEISEQRASESAIPKDVE